MIDVIDNSEEIFIKLGPIEKKKWLAILLVGIPFIIPLFKKK